MRFVIPIVMFFCIPAAAWCLPGYEEVRASFRKSDTLLLDRSGRVLHELRTDLSRRRLDWTGLVEMSPTLKRAVVLAEDKRFFAHGGVDWRALGAALAQGLRTGRLRGASTISMQLASLLDKGLQPAGGRRSFLQKWRQIQAAVELEREWGKDRVLEAYLNLIYFRGEFQGIAAASRGLFEKQPHGLDAAESMILAALIRAPNAAPADLAQRAQRLNRAAGLPAAASAIEAEIERMHLASSFLRPRADLAAHVARRLLRGDPGRPEVVSTLARETQEFARERLGHHLLPLQARHVGEGAALVAENATGRVLAYVSHTSDPSGSRFVDGVMARRQAGSTLKPFLYAVAFDRRILTPASRLDDSPLNLPVAGGIYQPGNYDGSFKGAVDARRALASSMNVPAVRALELVGGEALLRALRGLGFAGLRESGDWYGPALALGAADVSLWELVNAYRTLANSGAAGDLSLTPAAPQPAREQVFSPEAAFLVADILSDRQARSLTFGLENTLATRFWTAVKTGTSKDMRDNWCVGYSAHFTVGVWVGNFSGEPMWDVSGLTGAAPLWLELMNHLNREAASMRPEPPPGVVRSLVQAADGSAEVRAEWFIRGTEPAAPQVAAGGAAARIVYPPQGAILAVDPDIPSHLQRVFFISEGRTHGLIWMLDGRRLPGTPLKTGWTPVPGRHRLTLYDAAGRAVDAVRFQVRGAAKAAGAKPGPP
jgi:penicillin-binding protein 1C